MGSQHKPYGHHECYLAVKIVSNILKKAQGRKFEKECLQFIDYIIIYLHFQSKPLMNLKIFFATIHNLMKYINMIDSCQAHLPMQYASNIVKFEFNARSDTGVVNDSKPHLIRTCKTSLLFAPLAVRVHTCYSDFPFYTPNKTVNTIKSLTALFSKL